jgi:hypothetical protein
LEAVEEEGTEMRRKLLVAFVLAITLSFLVDRCGLSSNWPGSTPPDPGIPGTGLPASAAYPLRSENAKPNCGAAFPAERVLPGTPELAVAELGRQSFTDPTEAGKMAGYASLVSAAKGGTQISQQVGDDLPEVQ